MIKEAYCSFEVAKLLKEKEFEGDILMFIDKDNVKYDYTLSGFISDETIPCPTHQMAMKWLREVHDLHIIAYPYKRGEDEKGWCCQVYKTYNLLGQERYTDETLDSYEEAVEAALKYSLEKLI